MNKISKLVVFTLPIILIMVSQIVSVSAEITTDQSDFTMISIDERSMISNSETIMGNSSDSYLNLLIHSMSLNNENLHLNTNSETNITVTDTDITIVGPVNATSTSVQRDSLTTYQTDLYLKNSTVDARPSPDRNRTEPARETDRYSLEINDAIAVEFSYDDLQANTDFSEHVNDELGITAFVAKSGSLFTHVVKDADGNPIGEVLGFTIRISIYFYDTETKDFRGLHYTDDFGYGNSLPSVARNYLANGPFDDGGDSNNRERIKRDRIDWITLGFNETYELDLYLSFYHLERTSYRLLIKTLGHDQPTTPLSLSSTVDIESFAEEIVSQNEMQGFDEDAADDVEDEIVDGVLDEYSVPLSSEGILNSGEENKNSGVSNLDFPFVGLIAIAIIPVLHRKIRLD